MNGLGTQTGKDINVSELEMAASLPAIYSNRLLITEYGSGARITFLEANPGLPQPISRTALYIEYDVLELLSGELNRILEARKKSEEK